MRRSYQTAATVVIVARKERASHVAFLGIVALWQTVWDQATTSTGGRGGRGRGKCMDLDDLGQ